MKEQRRSVYAVRQEAVDFLISHCDSCVVSDGMRKLSFQNVEIIKSFCKITDRYESRRDEYGNVYNYFSIRHRENGVLTLSTAVLSEDTANEIEKLYVTVINKKTEQQVNVKTK